MSEELNPNYNNPPYYEDEEEGIDFIAIFKNLWEGRKTIIIWTVVFMLLGLVSALTMKRTYSVRAVIVPQINSRSNSSMSSLAALAGIDMGMNTSATDLSPLVYPQIVNSVPYRLELATTPYHYAKADTAVTMIDYAQNYVKPTPYVLKYTIGLPGVILGALQKKEPEEESGMPKFSSSGEENVPKPIVLTKAEARGVAAVGKSVSLDVDKKEGYLTLNVTGPEPIMTAELGTKALSLLQDEITRFRTEKVKGDLEYIEERYAEAKKEAESLQSSLAAVLDRSQGLTTTRARIEQERVMAKYNVANAVYSDLAKQREQARLQVKKETPVFCVVQPITVPRKASNSRAKTLIVWTFFGAILGCCAVMGKKAWPKIKAKFSSEEQAPENQPEN